VASTNAALDYLQHLHEFFGKDWLLALAAYNSGEGTVQRAITKNQRKNISTAFFNLNLPQQTRDYVPKLLALSTIFRNPAQYQLDLPYVENKPYLQTVQVKSQIDLAYAAELADIDLKLLYRLNPGFNRWATHPNGPQDLLLPADKAKRFKSNLLEADTKDLVHWKRYCIQQGDTLRSIAGMYRTTIDILKYVNNLKTNQLTVGQYLLIPNHKKVSPKPAAKNLLLGKTVTLLPPQAPGQEA
jgi:membrane-bound lytic murein transglycosylase D